MTNAQKTAVAYRMNLTGFEKLIQQCEALGKTYKPSAPKLKLTALNKLKDQVIQALKERREHEMAYLKDYSDRSKLDRDTRQLTKQIMKAFPSPVPPVSGNEMKKMSREEREKRERPAPFPFHEEIRRLHYSPGIRPVRRQTVAPQGGTAGQEQPRLTHREWYTRQATTLADLAGKIKTYESYTPDTDEIKPEALLERAREMQQKNEAIAAAAKAKKQADEKLYSLFYDAGKGLVATANAVKEYIAAEVDPEHDVARIAAVIQFKPVNQVHS